MERTAIFPGSFDPFTIGHESIVKRGLEIFDKIIISIGYNSNKPGYFPLNRRKEWIEKVFVDYENIKVETYDSLTTEFCRSKKIKYLLRGLRTAADFEYERAIAQVNKMLMPELETVFLLTTPEYTPITSTIVRDIFLHGGDTSNLVPAGMKLY